MFDGARAFLKDCMLLRDRAVRPGTDVLSSSHRHPIVAHSASRHPPSDIGQDGDEVVEEELVEFALHRGGWRSR